MQDLIKQLQEKAGLTEDQAQKSLQTIKEFIQSKLPPMMHGMVDSFMANNAGDDDDDILDSGDQGESFSDKAGKAMHNAADKVEDFAEDAADKMGDWAEKAENVAKDAFSKLKNMMKDKDEKL